MRVYKVRVTIKKYHDQEKNQLMKKGDIFETSLERADLLTKLGYIEILEIRTLEEKKPKRKPSKRKTTKRRTKKSEK